MRWLTLSGCTTSHEHPGKRVGGNLSGDLYRANGGWENEAHATRLHLFVTLQRGQNVGNPKIVGNLGRELGFGNEIELARIVLRCPEFQLLGDRPAATMPIATASP